MATLRTLFRHFCLCLKALTCNCTARSLLPYILPMLQFVVACTAGLIAIMLCTGCCACRGACYGRYTFLSFDDRN